MSPPTIDLIKKPMVATTNKEPKSPRSPRTNQTKKKTAKSKAV